MKQVKQIIAVCCAVFVASCGGSNPAAPSPTIPTPTPTPTAQTFTVTGTVNATNGNQALGGATVNIDNASGIVDGSGRFSITQPGPTFAALSITISGPNLLTRHLYAATSTRTLALDAIANSGGFDPAFYRRLVRDGFELPNALKPLARWTRTPNVYLKTVDEAGEAIHGPTLDLIEATIKETVPRWTSGALGTPTVTRGTESRVGVSGWITVRFPATVATMFCGLAQIGVDGGWVEFSYHVPTGAPINCRVPGAVIAPAVIRHEFGHALGLSHPSSDHQSDLMASGQWTDPNQQPSARELYHAAIAYTRPVGNIDPDADPQR